MFTSEDLFKLPYFTILHWENNCYELQSKNTKHYWTILVKTPSYHELLHKHHLEDSYHKQTSFCTLYEIILDIIEHDEYQMRGRKGKHKKGGYSYFEYFVEKYDPCNIQ